MSASLARTFAVNETTRITNNRRLSKFVRTRSLSAVWKLLHCLKLPPIWKSPLHALGYGNRIEA
jgi:hypothetical protein